MSYIHVPQRRRPWKWLHLIFPTIGLVIWGYWSIFHPPDEPESETPLPVEEVMTPPPFNQYKWNQYERVMEYCPTLETCIQMAPAQIDMMRKMYGDTDE